MHATVLVALLLTLTGCAKQLQRVPAQCDAMCFAPCVAAGEDTGVRVASAPEDPGAWDEIGEAVVGQLAGKLRSCDVRRTACVQCLQRLDHQRVIQL